MKNNLALVGFNYQKLKKLSAGLANTFSLREYDVREIFAFNSAPYSFDEYFNMNGIEFVNNEIDSVIESQCEFERTIVILEPPTIDRFIELINEVKAGNLVINVVDKNQTTYDCGEVSSELEKNYYSLDEFEVNEIKELISDKLADIEVDITGLNDEDATTRIVDAIYGYYGL